MNDISLKIALDTNEAQKLLPNFFSFAKGATAQPIVADVKTGQELYTATGEFKNFGDQIKIASDNTGRLGKQAEESAPAVASLAILNIIKEKSESKSQQMSKTDLNNQMKNVKAADYGVHLFCH